MLTELNIPWLDARIKALKLCFLYKILNNPSINVSYGTTRLSILPLYHLVYSLTTTVQPKWTHCSILNKFFFSLVLLFYGII